MKKTRRANTTITIAIALALALASAAVAAFAPSPGTAYAAGFIADCEGQQWFIDEVERLLNMNQKTINALNGASDLDMIKSLGLKDRGVAGKIPKAIGELRELRSPRYEMHST